MEQKIFDILSQINAEGIDNEVWTMAELNEEGTRKLFGTEEDIVITGKILALYVEPDDYFSFIKTETADEILTILNGTCYPTLLMIWYL